MPFYDYECEQCSYTFEDFQSIKNRLKPTETKCYICEGKIVLSINTIAFGDPSKYGHITKPDDGFRDKLKDIKKSHRGSTINTW